VRLAGRLLRALTAAALGAALCGPASAQAATVWAVGDGGIPGPEDDAVASRIESSGPFDRLLYLGDVYETGTAEEFAQNYHPSFGRFRERTSPTPGNHEWGNRASGYDPYWGPLAPQNDGGHWYSFDLGDWHVVSLNSQEDVSRGSPQLAWLRRDLSARPGRCTVAFFHRPRYAVSMRGDNPDLEAVWSELAGRATIALSGHEHNYQRFKPDRGVVQFVVGTGGRFRYELSPDPRLDFGTDDHFGALRLELGSGVATFEFISSEGARLDSGSLACTRSSATVAPFLTISRPRAGRTYSTRLRSFSGRARDVESAVQITLTRRLGRRCRWFDGQILRPASCRTRRWIPAGGSSTRWRLELPPGRFLPPGSYKLAVRGSAADGRAGRSLARFRIR
jgi:hypothetical protein